MQTVFDEFSNWVEGVNTSAPSDMLPPATSPRGRNTILTNIGQGAATVGKRRGLEVGNLTSLTGSPAVLGQFQFKKSDTTKVHLLVSDGGRLDKYNADTSTSAIDATAFTAGTKYPAFAVAQDLCFIANGTNLKKVNTAATAVQTVGITRPAAPTAVSNGGGGLMAVGVWDIALTYFNSLTGHESSLSNYTTVTTVATDKINISWTAPTDTQVDYVRVYARLQSLGPNPYLLIGASLVPAPNTTWNGFAVATVATVLNMAVTTYQALIIVGPTITENNPPTVTWNYPVWHNSRLFLFDSGNAYYSGIKDLTPHPESFDPFNVQPINPQDGDIIVGAASAFERLYIFKKFSTWQIVGSDPNAWEVSLVSATYGAASHRSIAEAGGVLYWWANSSLGPLALAGAGAQPLEMGKELLNDTLSDASLANTFLSVMTTFVDENNELVLFVVPAAGSTTRNTLVLPFNYRIRRFVSDGWNPMDICSACVVEDASSTKTVYVGGYAGQIFKWSTGLNDGVPTGTTGSGLVTAATTATISDVGAGALFYATGGRLIERYVYVISAAGGVVQRRRITFNTLSQLTITPDWDSIPIAGDRYIIGGIDWQWDTPWSQSGAAFLKKRYGFLSVETSTAYSEVSLSADVFTSRNEAEPRKTLTYSLATTSAPLYDAPTSKYDAVSYATTQHTKQRKRVGVTGQSFLVRIRQLQAETDFTLHKIQMMTDVLSPRT